MIQHEATVQDLEVFHLRHLPKQEELAKQNWTDVENRVWLLQSHIVCVQVHRKNLGPFLTATSKQGVNIVNEVLVFAMPQSWPSRSLRWSAAKRRIEALRIRGCVL